ncbi:trehalase family glycosidase [Aquicella lusitana]|uniref:Alpha,alpha-trehalase n=1 Tax=Aquicella lusitana TaxID=254246 RepID=A0A370GE60_9COXI|nr:trehalase family glycosidase [Aquicella lusitana]RDI41530.1 alpha,alpha-trehalase [Aquicella lusitana]VVC72576.1 Periplasmic trehalase [Aquicella lusitana]
MKRNGIISIILLLVALCLPAWVCAENNAQLYKASNPYHILDYISNGWSELKRSIEDCHTFTDPKTHMHSILYIPADFPLTRPIQDLQKRCSLTLKRLPRKITQLGEIDANNIQPAGLLYLPHPYVVPGGMFNEMYGWDSYFIIRGLLEDKKFDLAHNMIENFFFEIEHYGSVLNGNRTYYLTRSQLPFLTSMIRALYEAEKKHHRANLAWLKKAYGYAVRDYNLWTRSPHLAGNTGLSRFYDFGQGPVPELDDTMVTYYEDVIRYFLHHPHVGKNYLEYVSRADTKKHIVMHCPPGKKQNRHCKKKAVTLNARFYQGDRAMRESGFDISFRFGPFGADTLDYAPVDLNSLLYKAEKDLAWMSKQLGRKQQAKIWRKRACQRRKLINRYLWNDKQGLYYDYNARLKRQSSDAYASAFYPLWAGLASRDQAAKLTANLTLFEKSGGVVTSLHESGVQWDYPYGWAPLQLITVEGLYQYGYKQHANRISSKFLSMVLHNFARDQTIWEKYNVISGSSQTQIKVGYKVNVIGFGWTNGTFLALLRQLPRDFAQTELGLVPDKTVQKEIRLAADTTNKPVPAQ